MKLLHRNLVLVGALLILSKFFYPLSLSAQELLKQGSWPQWGGPDRNFIVEVTGLAESWPEDGPPVIWTRPLGPGHSSIVVDEGRLFTMYRVGNGREKAGPWDKEEIVVALDAKTGDTLWEYKYPSLHENFAFGSGPHSTPLIQDGRLFTTGTNKQLHAFDAESGELLWSHDLIKDFNAPELLFRAMVKSGYSCSLIAFKDTVICSVGGPGQAVMAFRQKDGKIVWKSGDFLIAQVPPVLIELAGQHQLIIVGGGTINGIDPSDGKLLWSYPHDPGNDINLSMPFWGSDNILVMSTAYKSGSRALQLIQDDVTTVKELWFTNRTRFMFLNAFRLGDYVYGTSGDFGPAFLTALNVRTGEPAWRHRGFARASLIYADGKAIILDENGDLAIAKVSPEKVKVLSRANLFDTTSWSVPSLVGKTLYARDREKIVAINLGAK